LTVSPDMRTILTMHLHRNARRKPSKAQAHLVRRLQAHGVVYNDVARLAGVSWRMVKHVMDGTRTSAKVMAAIDRLAPVRPKSGSAA